MDFNLIVEYYDRIGAIRGRLEIIDILSEMFTECIKPDNVQHLSKIIYLTQGQLVSKIKDWPKFGVAEKLIIQTMVKFTTIPAEKIKDLVNKYGDTGDAVKHLLEKRAEKKVSFSLDAFTSNKTSSSKNLDISLLYNELTKLSKATGAGSQDKKQNIIKGLLSKSTPSSAKYIINIILSNLRIGIADKSIMDGITKAILGSKEKREEIERAYNIFPDLGKIAEIFVHDGLTGIQNIDVQVGIPIQMMLASRIQYNHIQEKLGGGEFIAEYKYDGERVQIHKQGKKVQLYSRQLKNITNQYPDIVENVIQYVKTPEGKNVIFEGEAVAMDTSLKHMLPFQVLSTRRRKYDIEKKIQETPVCLFCFDVLYVDGKNVMNEPFEMRRELLEKIIPKTDNICPSILKKIHNQEEMVEFFEKSRQDGAEGIMNKALTEGSIYNPGNRGFLWIKLKGLEGAKMLDTIDVVIIGGSWAKGRKKGTLSPVFGAVLNAKTNEYEFLTRIGSGFSDDDSEYFTKELQKLILSKQPKNVSCSDAPDVWVEPKIVIEITGDELSISNKADAGASVDGKDGYGLRFPVYQRLRTEKDKTQITTTGEIKDLYMMQ